MSAPKTPIIAGSRDALTKFKLEVASELGLTQNCKEYNDHYKGNLSSRENGHTGGPIGGEMVKRMISMAEKQL